jgi:hypothetical protein
LVFFAVSSSFFDADVVAATMAEAEFLAKVVAAAASL